MIILFLAVSIGFADQSLGKIFKDAVSQAYKVQEANLKLKPFERKIFETEVLPHASFFIRNVDEIKNENLSVKPEVELSRLVAFTRFHDGRSQVCLVTRVMSSCSEACKNYVKPIEKKYSDSLSRRGFVTKVIPLQPVSTAGFDAAEFYLSKNKHFECNHILYSELEVDKKIDTHESEEDIPLKVTSYFILQDNETHRVRSLNSAIVPRNFIEDEHFDFFVFKLKAELFIEAFKPSRVSESSKANAQNDFYLKVEGIDSYQTYTRFKQMLLANIVGLKLEEKFMSPGVFWFHVRGSLSIDDIILSIKKIPWPRSYEVKKEEFDLSDEDTEGVLVVLK